MNIAKKNIITSSGYALYLCDDYTCLLLR